MDSSPKRVTRARAAIKATKPGLKPATTSSTSTSTTTTKIVTAAAKVRSAPALSFMAGTTSTAAKRKTRSDEKDDEDLQRREMMSKRPKGSSGSGSGSGMMTAMAHKDKSEAAAPTTRRNMSKPPKLVAKKPVGRPPSANSHVAAKPARGRPPKVAATQEGKNAGPSERAASASTRSRFSASTSSTTARAAATTRAKASATTAAKPPVKKAVAFREPDKENVDPPAASKEPVATSLRGRPAKRGGAAMAAATSRATTKTKSTSTTGPGTKKKLSPTPPAQPFSLWQGSDNEPDETPIKPIMKSPIKPPTAKKTDAKDAEMEPEDDANSAAMFNPLDVNTVLLGSPVRPPRSPLGDTLKSPAKRIGAMNLPASTLKLTTDEQSAQSPVKINLLQSAAKRPQSAIKGLIFNFTHDSQSTESPSKLTLLQSPAKRALPGFKPSAIELLTGGVSSLPGFPELNPMALGLMATSSKKPSERLLYESEMNEDTDEDDVFTGPIEAPRFSRRSPEAVSKSASSSVEKLEAVYEADDSVDLVPSEMEKEQSVIVDESEVDVQVEDGANHEETADDDETMDEAGGPMTIEEAVDATEDAEPVEEIEDVEIAEAALEANELSESSLAKSTPEQANANMQLRDKDQDPCHDMSMLTDMDDDTLRFDGMASTPFNYRSAGITSCVSKSGRRSTLGFTPLAHQLNTWAAASPVKAPLSTRKVKFATPIKDDTELIAEDVDSPMGGTGKDDEIVDSTPESFGHGTPVSDTLFFDDEVIFTEEDLALFREAEEMSILGPNGNGATDAQRLFDDGLSDASQEYGDENVSNVPHFPIMEAPVAVTPVRSPMKAFSTTTKVPLKPADYSSPSPRKRVFSAPATTPRTRSKLSKVTNAASPSPVPSKSTSSTKGRRVSRGPHDGPELAAPSTPIMKGKSRMVAEIPGRTPRKDHNPTLLRGAVVFVDAHTEEGADASGLFVELLSQMGARSVKNWNWTPGSPSGGSASSNKVGITHVVFKDGSKRTLEKVREANGVVQCVGVSWVLDCEKHNAWVDEASYRIDTSNVPRGGGRRRKSMEPTALANMNGSGSRNSRGSGRESPVGLSTPTRRQSHVWEFRPAEPDEEVEGEELDEESTMLLTPVPKTPAPEALARFAADVSSDEDDDEDEDEDELSPLRRDITRTCPPKQRFREAGGGILTRAQDDHMAVQLMAARRRSLQFAPKVGSPLAKMWR